ncbi:hypothetical protein AB1282_19830 [Gottfriedia sp. S16(2024)]|uniref:hypothetical protein n=1 Tax=Gottfriedia sp. S16(2024) TaxID=3162883 RepID=UPI003D220A4F
MVKLSNASWIRWYEDGMSFSTMRESHEWAYNVIYNEIGNLYDGYKTTDEKIASSLVFELVRLNTLTEKKHAIFSDYEKVNNQLVFMVWVQKI